MREALPRSLENPDGPACIGRRRYGKRRYVFAAISTFVVKKERPSRQSPKLNGAEWPLLYGWQGRYKRITRPPPKGYRPRSPAVHLAASWARIPHNAQRYLPGCNHVRTVRPFGTFDDIDTCPALILIPRWRPAPQPANRM